MGIGASITLIALGAILTFGIRGHVPFLNLANIGIILMVVGAIGLAVTTLIWGPRRGARVPVDDQDDLVEERRIVGRRPKWR